MLGSKSTPVFAVFVKVRSSPYDSRPLYRTEMQPRTMLAVAATICVAVFVLYISFMPSSACPSDLVARLREELADTKQKLVQANSELRKAKADGGAHPTASAPHALVPSIAQPTSQGPPTTTTEDVDVVACKEKQSSRYRLRWNTTDFYSDVPLEAFWNSFDGYTCKCL